MGFFDSARNEMAKGFMEGLSEKSDDDPFKKMVNDVIKTTEAVIEIYVEHIIRPSSREEYIGPKGLTDIIGGMYGNTAIRKERKVKYTPAKTKWIKDKLILQKRGFIISSTSKIFLYKDVSSVRVEEGLYENDKNKGRHVYINLKIEPFNLSFRTPQAYKVQQIINNKIGNENTSTMYENFEMQSGMPSGIYETSIRDIIDNQDKLEITKSPKTNNKNEETKSPETNNMYEISIRDIIDNQDKLEITKSPETNDKNEEKSFSVADELMKFGELYKQGLLTEEEFNTMKKKLLGL